MIKLGNCLPLKVAVMGVAMLGGPVFAEDFTEQLKQIQKALAITEKGRVLRYKNGQVATNSAHEKGYKWYYPNGQVITNSAGESGYNWYYPNGQKICSSMGTAGYSWYYSNGKQMTSSGPKLTDDELLDVPSLLLEKVDISDL